MKTFKWSIPEPRLSQAEKRDHLDYEQNRKENTRSTLRSEHPLYKATAPLLVAINCAIRLSYTTDSVDRISSYLLGFAGLALTAYYMMKFFKIQKVGQMEHSTR
ncbi:Unannotated [Lentimonas sp. CC19]|nr:Unannotated [Lentimonas sp. CC10]CAA6691003.1 Unannotated [Lentimonas sp. CC19]CAA7069370.1 Unannotated [Lentimonas sp. CC11]